MEHAFRSILLLLVFCESLFAQTSENSFLPSGVADTGWTTVRGPNYDGHSKEISLADEWTEDGPPILWTRELGQGYSAFVAVGDRVYTQAQNLGGQYVYCLNADTGETIWSHRYDWPYEAVGVYPGPRGTPTLADGFVYFSGPSGLVGCLDAESGREVWSVNVIEQYEGDGGIGFGYSCSPVVMEGRCYLPVGGKSASIVALDARTGKEVWSEGDDPGSYSPVFPLELGGRKLLLGYLQNSLVLHDRTTGELLVRRELSHGYDEHSAWPIYREPHLWISGPFRSGSRLLKLPESLTRDFELVWNSRLLSNDVSSSVMVDGFVYGFDIYDVQSKTQRPSRGKFVCLDFQTGEEQWSQGSGVARRRPDDNLDEIGQSGIIAADGKLIVFNERGELILLEATPEECRILARHSILGGELSWTPPALHRGRVYLRNQSRAVCVFVGQPELLKTERDVLKASDVPQTQYRDLAAAILKVEPEYMFDVPSDRWLWNWYLVCLAMLVVAGVVATLAARFVTENRRGSVRTGSFLGLAFVLGALGTTFLSEYRQDFIFTWPLCLFVAFQPIARSAFQNRQLREQKKTRLRDRLKLIPLLIVCWIYFWLCRRLSLVFEWTFLMGFPGAIPFYWIEARIPESNRSLLKSGVLVLLAFSGFYICGILPYWVKY